MKKEHSSSLTELVAKLLQDTTEANPMHWSVLTEEFVDSGQWTNEQLVSTVNSLLVPAGSVRGSNHYFWFEPLS